MPRAQLPPTQRWIGLENGVIETYGVIKASYDAFAKKVLNLDIQHESKDSNETKDIKF